MIKKKYLKQYLSSTHNIISAFVLTSPPSLSSLTALNPGNMSITKPPSGFRSALTRFATELFSFSSRWNCTIKKPPDGRYFFGDPSEVAAADALSSFHSDRLRRPLRADALCDRTLLVLIPLEFCHKKTARWAAFFWRPQRDSNSRYRRERAMSWASRRWGQKKMAGVKGLEPSTFCVTGRRSNQLSYTPIGNQDACFISEPKQKSKSFFHKNAFFLKNKAICQIFQSQKGGLRHTNQFDRHLSHK